MRILIGAQFLFAKSLICKAFSILFNDIRLCGTPETVAAEPFSFSPTTPFNKRSRGVHFRQKGCAYFNYSSRAQKKGCKTVKNSLGLIKTVLESSGVSMPDKLAIGRKERKKKDPIWLEPDEIKKFVAAAADDPLRVPMLLALMSMRISEIDALRWENIPPSPRIYPHLRSSHHGRASSLGHTRRA